MSSFTSAFISTANLGSWDYYIFSDNVGIWRAMNGLAAWFNASGGMIQGAAWLGALLLLAMILFAAATHKSGLGASTLGVWFFFMAMMGTTGQANVYNIYTGQITVIQNVPALALIPASVFSKAAYKVFVSMDTAFQSVNGSYMTVSQNGFMGPLEILLSLRSPKLSAATPALNLTLTQVIHDCAVDASTTPPTAMNDSLDMLNWLTLYGRQFGLTRVYTEVNSQGQIMGCGAALTYINDQYGLLANGSTPLIKFVNASTSTKNPQDTKGLWNASSVSGSYDMIVGQAVNVQQSATQFTKNALVASTVSYTMDCLGQSGSITSPENCATSAFVNADTMSRWQTEAAMNGSGFLKTMFTSMALLQALFFALFPIIALYGLIVVQNTAKIFGGYIFFGVWCQSWLLVVAPIQSYIQTSIVDEMTKITAGSGGMTLANSMQLYTTLATKLAVASDIMASSQMLSLALLSGSMIALSSLAGKWSGEKHVDTSKVQLDPAKTGPMVSNNPLNSVSSIVNSQGQSVGVMSEAGATKAAINSSVTRGRSGTHSADIAYKHDRSRSQESALAMVKSSGIDVTQSQASEIAKGLASATEWKGSVAGIAGAVGAIGKGAMTKLNGGSPPTSEQDAKLKIAQDKAITQATADLATSDASFLSNLMGKNGGEAQADAAGKLIDGASVALMAGEMFATGGAALATAPAQMALRAAGKAAVKKTIMEGAKKETAAGAAGGIGRLAQGADAAANVAKAITGDMAAIYSASVKEDLKQTDKDASGKSLKRSETDSASQADKLGQTWSRQDAVGESQSDSSGQSNVASIVLDQNSIMRAAVKGVDGQSPEETRRNAALNNKMLRASRTDAQNAAADAFAAQAMEGWTVADFGGGAKGQAVMDFAKNVFFEHGSIQSVTGSMTAQNPLNQLVGGVPAQEVPIEKLKNLPSSALGSGFQAGFGQNYIESADRKNFIRYMQLPTAAQSNAVNSAQAYAELKDKTNKTQEEITWIAGASALGKTIGLANATGQGRTKTLGQ